MADARWFTVLGDGAMGTACALLLAKKPGRRVSIWCQFPEQATALRADRENRKYLPGVPLSESLEFEPDFAKLAGSDAFILAIPTVYLGATLQRLKPLWPSAPTVDLGAESAGLIGPPIFSVAKGLERETLRTPTAIVRETLGRVPVGALIGPSHAEEIARGMPASLLAASDLPELAVATQRWFNSETFRVYTSTDLLGAELCGALKNVIAIAAGVCDGMGLGDNAKSALMTRGLAEMRRFGTALGAQSETFFGLAGLGDLITTCVSPHGRNRKVGELLGRGQSLDEILKGMYQVAEGVWTCQGVLALAREKGIELPITRAVHAVLFEGMAPGRAVAELMSREPGPEG
jgi:glycerol-3-phosphate dehydrogenase (NAD(P)+)